MLRVPMPLRRAAMPMLERALQMARRAAIRERDDRRARAPLPICCGARF